MSERLANLRRQPVNDRDIAAHLARERDRAVPKQPPTAIGRDLLIGGSGEVLLVVPPFASLWYPSLGIHQLQACVRETGVAVDVLYANLLLARTIGEAAYEHIEAESISMAAERFFARCAFDLPSLGHGADQAFDPARIYGTTQAQLCEGLYPDSKAASMGRTDALTVEEFARLEKQTDAWLRTVATRIASRPYRIVGATSTFQQTSASVSLLRYVKALRPDIVTVLGGANCEGQMAEGIVSLEHSPDYVFSGESEETFPRFVQRVLARDLPEPRIVVGRPCRDMDALPDLDYREFFTQRGVYMPASAPASATQVSYETSRGCWWGQKQHCTFCGLNGEGMGFRSKSAGRALGQLRRLLDQSPTRNVSMTDNIMPHDYFRTFVPRVQEEVPGVSLFYEQKANLTLHDMLAFKAAGITIIQPGIEALSTGLLKVMRKGVKGRQNLMLLRYGRVCGIQLVWNLICGFPQDELAFYQETLDMVPLLHHLEPPNGVFHLSIERFSPYFERPGEYGIEDIQPLPVYADFFPAGAKLGDLAYHFVGKYKSETHTHIEVVRSLRQAVAQWRSGWAESFFSRPELKICRDRHGLVLIDTRRLPQSVECRPLSRTEASSLLSARPYTGAAEEKEAVAAGLALRYDGWFVPLPIATSEIFCEFTTERQHAVARTQQGLITLEAKSRRTAASA